MRIPFDPPYTKDDLPQLDKIFDAIGLGDFWMYSDARKDIAGGKVRHTGFRGPVPRALFLDEIEDM